VFEFFRGSTTLSVKALEFGLEEAKRIVRKEVEQLESGDMSYKRGKSRDRGTSDPGDSTYGDTEVVQVRALQHRPVTQNFQAGGGGFRGGNGGGFGQGGQQGQQPQVTHQRPPHASPLQLAPPQQTPQTQHQGWQPSQSSNQPQSPQQGVATGGQQGQTGGQPQGQSQPLAPGSQVVVPPVARLPEAGAPPPRWGFTDCHACGRGGHWMETCPYRTQGSWDRFPPGSRTRPWIAANAVENPPRMQSGLQMALESGLGGGGRLQNQ